MSVKCEHLQGIVLDPTPPGGCIECLKIGGTWVHLRFCVTCRATRCCNESPNRHALKHYRSSGHPVIRSKEPGESWAWCWADDVGRRLPETTG